MSELVLLKWELVKYLQANDTLKALAPGGIYTRRIPASVEAASVSVIKSGSEFMYSHRGITGNRSESIDIYVVALSDEQSETIKHAIIDILKASSVTQLITIKAQFTLVDDLDVEDETSVESDYYIGVLKYKVNFVE